MRHVTISKEWPPNIDEIDAILKVRAIPGAGSDVPIWILGSSLYGAQLAAALGLPYAFASHFAPAELVAAVGHYRHARFMGDGLDFE